MSFVSLSLLLAAATPQPKPVVVQMHVVATVQIIAAEEIRFKDVSKTEPKTTHRQKRVRDGMPMIEFY